MEPVKFEVFDHMKKDMKKAGLVAWLYVGWQLWFSFLISFATSLIVNLLFFNNFFGRIFWMENIQMINLFVVTILSGLFTALIMSKKCGLDLSWKKLEIKDALTGIVLILGLNGIFAFLTALFTSLFGIELNSPDFSMHQSGVYNLFLILSTCLAAPIFEEVVFRGMIYKVLAKYNVWMAMVISSLLFGLVHFNLSQGIPAFFMALVLAGAYAKTDSLFVPILIHGINNLMASISSLDSSGFLAMAYTLIMLVCTVLTIVLAVTKASQIKKWLLLQMQDYPYTRWALKSPSILAFVIVGVLIALLYSF